VISIYKISFDKENKLWVGVQQGRWLEFNPTNEKRLE
jgi:ligand-binding sensor domain-containing protein